MVGSTIDIVLRFAVITITDDITTYEKDSQLRLAGKR